jgi:hypothetical protein
MKRYLMSRPRLMARCAASRGKAKPSLRSCDTATHEPGNSPGFFLRARFNMFNHEGAKCR